MKLIPSPRSLESKFDFVFWLCPLFSGIPLEAGAFSWVGGWVPVSRGRRWQSHIAISIFKGRSQQEGYKHVCPIFRLKQKRRVVCV